MISLNVLSVKTIIDVFPFILYIRKKFRCFEYLGQNLDDLYRIKIECYNNASYPFLVNLINEYNLDKKFKLCICNKTLSSTKISLIIKNPEIESLTFDDSVEKNTGILLFNHFKTICEEHNIVPYDPNKRNIKLLITTNNELLKYLFDDMVFIILEYTHCINMFNPFVNMIIT